MITSEQEKLINKLFGKLPDSDDLIRSLYRDIQKEEKLYRDTWNYSWNRKYNASVPIASKLFLIQNMIEGSQSNKRKIDYDDVLYGKITNLKGKALGIKHKKFLKKSISKEDIKEFEKLKYEELVK